MAGDGPGKSADANINEVRVKSDLFFIILPPRLATADGASHLLRKSADTNTDKTASQRGAVFVIPPPRPATADGAAHLLRKSADADIKTRPLRKGAVFVMSVPRSRRRLSDGSIGGIKIHAFY